MRPYTTTGIALVGAAVIAVAPIAPPTSEFAKPISDAAVRLAAAPNPIDFYSAIFDRTVLNAGAVLDNYLADPFPIIRAIIANQVAAGEAIGGALGDAADGIITNWTTVVPALLGQALDELLALNVAGAVELTLDAALALLLPLQAPIGVLVDVAINPLRNLLAAIDAVVSHPAVNLETLLTAAIGPVLAGIQGAAVATQNVIDAVIGLDPLDLVNAVVDFPGYVIDGVLNGGYFALGGLIPAPGLLNPGFFSGDPATPLPGLINWFVEADQHIGGALEPCCTTVLTLNQAPEPDPEFAAFSLGEGTEEGDQSVDGEEDGQADGEEAGGDEADADGDEVDGADGLDQEDGDANEDEGEDNSGTTEVRDSLNFSPDSDDPDGEAGADADADGGTEVDPTTVDNAAEGAGDAGDEGSEAGGQE
jgi:hypothetical protein